MAKSLIYFPQEQYLVVIIDRQSIDKFSENVRFVLNMQRKAAEKKDYPNHDKARIESCWQTMMFVK